MNSEYLVLLNKHQKANLSSFSARKLIPCHLNMSFLAARERDFCLKEKHGKTTNSSLGFVLSIKTCKST